MWKKKWLCIIGITVGIYLAFRFLLPLVVPFLIAGLIAILYYPLLRKLWGGTFLWKERSRGYLLMVSVVLLYAVLLAVLWLIGSYLWRQGEVLWLNLPFYQTRLYCFVRDCCCQLDTWFCLEDGVCYEYIRQWFRGMEGESFANILPRVTGMSVQLAGNVFQILFQVVIAVIATFLMIQDYERIREGFLGNKWGRRVCQLLIKCKETLKTYLKAQGVIMLLDGTVCTIAFLLIHQPFAWVLGPLVAIVDALPVFGAGCILLPYILFLLLTKAFGKAAIVFGAYVACVMIRQLTEPKMIGNQMGMRPLYTIFAMYVGFQLFGVFGFLLGPVGVLIGRELYKSLVGMQYNA